MASSTIAFMLNILQANWPLSALQVLLGLVHLVAFVLVIFAASAMVIALGGAANLSFWPLVKCHLKEP